MANEAKAMADVAANEAHEADKASVAIEANVANKVSEFKPLSWLNSCLNRIVSFVNINSVSLKTSNKNLNVAMRAF